MGALLWSGKKWRKWSGLERRGRPTCRWMGNGVYCRPVTRLHPGPTSISYANQVTRTFRCRLQRQHERIAKAFDFSGLTLTH